MDFGILFLVGAAVGFLSSFFGIGGGALIVPILYSLYPNITDTVVISTSLGTIFFITIINSIHFYRQKLTPTKPIAMVLLISTFLGGWIGSQLTYLVDTNISKKIIATTLIIIVIKNLFFTTKLSVEEERETKLFIASTGFLGSLVSAVTGLGGGIIFIPMLMTLVRLSPKKVSPYSNLAMVFATFIGCVPHLFHSLESEQIISEGVAPFFIGQVNFAIIFILAASAFFTSKLGVKFNDLVSVKNKRIILSLLLLTLSLKLFLV